MDKVREEVMAKYTPQVVEDVTGVPEAEMYEVAKILAENRPGFIIWAMGQTQHTNGNAVVRASAVLMLALGNVGRSGGARTSTAATTTCRARPTSGRTRIRCRAITACCLDPSCTGRGCGTSTSTG